MSRQQRINGVGAEIVTHLRDVCEKFRGMLEDGITLAAGVPRKELPAFKCTGDEVKESLADNLKAVETVLAFVLDGKSNDITKAVKAQKAPKPTKP